MESLRLDPPNPMSQILQATQEIKISKQSKLPKGTRFQFNLLAVNREVTQYADAEKFIPERFDPENALYHIPGGTKLRHPLSWSPFMTGDKQSSGQDFTFMVSKVVSSMLITAMPKIAFVEEIMKSRDAVPSSNTINGGITTVQCKAPLPFNI